MARSTKAHSLLTLERLELDLRTLILARGAALERRLDWKREVLRGDVLEAWQDITAGRTHAGETWLLESVDEATFEGVAIALSIEPTPDRLRSYFGWAAANRAPIMAALAIRTQGDVAKIESKAVPERLRRLGGGSKLFKRYAVAVAMEFRRQQASFEAWSHMTGLLASRVVYPKGWMPTDSLWDGSKFDEPNTLPADARADGDPGTDPLAGWQPNFTASDILPLEEETYSAAADVALVRLGLENPNFYIESTTVRDRVDALLLDEVSGIDETTRTGLADILSSGLGQTVGELASEISLTQEISDYWDGRVLVGAITIAASEMARAAAGAELDSYRYNEVAKVRFAGGESPSDGPGAENCNDYLDQVFDVGEAEGIIPVHPNCTHYWEPVLRDDYSIGSSPWTGGQPPEEELSDL